MAHLYNRSLATAQIDSETIKVFGTDSAFSFVELGGEASLAKTVDRTPIVNMSTPLGVSVMVHLCLSSSSIDMLDKLMRAQKEAPAIGQFMPGHLFTCTDTSQRQYAFYDCWFGENPSYTGIGSETMPTITFNLLGTRYSINQYRPENQG